MRAIFVGQLGRGQTSGMRCAALRRLGFDVAGVDTGTLWDGAGYLERLVEQRRESGARIRGLNARVLAAAAETKPAFAWFEKQEHIDPEVLATLRARGVMLVHYNPDPYFTLPWKRTRNADACIPLYDALVVTKRYELEQYRALAKGAVVYSPLGFDVVAHAPAHDAAAPRYDVSFVGGWEPRRERYLARTSRLSERVAVWGYGWRLALQASVNPVRALRLGRLAPGARLYWRAGDPVLSPFIQQGEVASGEIYEERYAGVVGGSAVSLGFLREVCPDQHTTRSFEIPAMGGFMLADRSEEHCELFEEGEEAEFFDSEAEFLSKLQFYLSHEPARRRIAMAGRRRCLRSGYSYDERLAQVTASLGLIPGRA